MKMFRHANLNSLFFILLVLYMPLSSGIPDGWGAGQGGSGNISVDAGFENQSPEGCSPDYWSLHPESWEPTGLSPAMKVKSVFSVPLY
ncbi:MAG TPA: hypothetical protein PK360_11200, partial [bacterium]|nr:hypothetical protein [bacterium]